MKKVAKTLQRMGVWSALALVCAGTAQAQRETGAPARSLSSGEIALVSNSQQALPVSGIPLRVLIDDPAVADVQVLPGTGTQRRAEVFLQGREPGRTVVRVWLQGQAQPQAWEVLVVSAAHAQMLARQQAQQGGVDVAGGTALLSGQYASLQEHAAAYAVAHASAEQVMDLSTVGVGQTVQVEVKVVEVSTTVLKEVGINWRGGRTGNNWYGGNNVSAADTIVGDGFSLLYGARNFSASLNLLQSNGMARILAEPTLVALSGQSASFLAGGEIPVPAAGSLGTQSVEFKSFGIGLSVTPTVLSRDRIALKVAPEASELDYTNAVRIGTGDSYSLIPAIRTRRTDTTVELADGESFVISGLVSRATTASVDKLPVLGDLPIIGAFFRNMNYQQEERELVIVVTPRLVRAIAKDVTLPLPGEAQTRPDGVGNAWSYYLVGPAIGQSVPGFSR